MRPGYEGLAISLIMLAVAWAIMAVIKLAGG